MKYLLLSLLVLAGCGTTDPVPQYNTTNIHEYDTTMYVMVGKVMVPQVTHHSDCIQWSKK